MKFFNAGRTRRKAKTTTQQFSTMSAQGATLQNYNNDLVKCIEDLREKREELNKQICKEEEDKGKSRRSSPSWPTDFRRSTNPSSEKHRRVTSTTRQSRKPKPRTWRSSSPPKLFCTCSRERQSISPKRSRLPTKLLNSAVPISLLPKQKSKQIKTCLHRLYARIYFGPYNAFIISLPILTTYLHQYIKIIFLSV